MSSLMAIGAVFYTQRAAQRQQQAAGGVLAADGGAHVVVGSQRPAGGHQDALLLEPRGQVGAGDALDLDPYEVRLGGARLDAQLRQFLSETVALLADEGA